MCLPDCMNDSGFNGHLCQLRWVLQFTNCGFECSLCIYSTDMVLIVLLMWAYVKKKIFNNNNSLEQCSLTGGKESSLAISVFFSFKASSTVLPFTHSVANELEAIAEPHPKVLNFASMILPFSSTLICNFITSPQAGAPTRPVPTLLSFLSRDPTLRGFS